jgi:hypothetical protein
MTSNSASTLSRIIHIPPKRSEDSGYHDDL